MTNVDLRHLPDSISLPKAWLRASILLVFAVALFVGGLLMIRDGETAGWFVTIFFGLCGIAFVWVLIGGSGVELDREGFSVRSFFVTTRYAWRDVSEFSHARVGRTRMFLFDDLTKKNGALGKLNRFMSGRNAGFPAGFIGGSRDETCALLNAFRARALR